MPAVALVVIAKNEERSIGRLLDSAKQLVDEMVVLDTGSDDGTAAIAKAAGAKVRHFAWVDDFSAARNRALELTDAPWRLVLDADEWLSPETCDIRQLCEEEPTFVGRIKIDSSFQSVVSRERKRLTSCTWISRLLPKGVTYTGAIHEQPTHTLPTTQVPIHVLHDGYEDIQLEKKGDRNLVILEKCLSTTNDDAYYRYQYAKELIRKERIHEAVQHLSVALKNSKKNAPWREALVCALVNSYGRVGMFELAIELIDIETIQYSNSAEFWFIVGSFCMDLAQARPANTNHALSLMETAFLRCLEIGERPNGEGILGRGSYLAAQNLYALYVATNQTERAETFRILSKQQS